MGQWLKTRGITDHSCVVPDYRDVEANDAGNGAIWACDDCGAIWKLTAISSANQRVRWECIGKDSRN